MSQERPEPRATPPKRIKVEKDPSPEDEGSFFSTADEKKLHMQNKHALDLMDRHLGVLGRYTGSTNPSLNIAFVIAGALFVALIGCIIGIMCDKPAFIPFVEKIIAAIISVASFIFGAHVGGGQK